MERFDPTNDFYGPFTERREIGLYEGSETAREVMAMAKKVDQAGQIPEAVIFEFAEWLFRFNLEREDLSLLAEKLQDRLEKITQMADIIRGRALLAVVREKLSPQPLASREALRNFERFKQVCFVTKMSLTRTMSIEEDLSVIRQDQMRGEIHKKEQQLAERYGMTIPQRRGLRLASGLMEGDLNQHDLDLWGGQPDEIEIYFRQNREAYFAYSAKALEIINRIVDTCEDRRDVQTFLRFFDRLLRPLNLGITPQEIGSSEEEICEICQKAIGYLLTYKSYFVSEGMEDAKAALERMKNYLAVGGSVRREHCGEVAQKIGGQGTLEALGVKLLEQDPTSPPEA